MSISTMEALSSMTTGSEIRVDSNTHGYWTFTRVEGGWSREGAVVKDDFFSGYVTAGKVTDASQLMPRIGDWYESNRYWTWVLANPDEAEQVKVLRFLRTGAWRAPIPETILVRNLNGPRARAHRVNETPAGVLVGENLRWLLDQWLTTESTVEELRSERETLVTERNTFKNRPNPDHLQPALQDAERALAQLRGLIGPSTTTA